MLSLKYPKFDGNKKIDDKSVFMLYMSVRNHFVLKNYDAVKYNYSVNVSNDAFNKRGDRKMFEILSSKYTVNELTEIFISNFVYSRDNWVNHMITNEAETIRHRYVNVLKSFSTIFRKDMEKIMSAIRSFNRQGNDLTFKDFLSYNEKMGSSPLLNMLYREDISSETFIVLDSMMNLIEKEYIKIPRFNLQWSKNRDFFNKYKLLMDVNKLDLANDIILGSKYGVKLN